VQEVIELRESEIVNRLALERRGGWWLLWSKRDWLETADQARVFRAIVHNPRGGRNNMYFEVLLSAFAQDVVTAVHGAVDVVKGSLDAELEPALQQLGDAGRVVAFRS
jgi:hypothetical protein